MSLESATKISELVATNPTGGDPKSQGDDHIRLIKSVLQADALSKADLPAGAIMDFAMNSAPDKWLACDGAIVSRATYATLFAAIGTTWGAGDGSTTFAIPDFRGYFRRGSGTNADGTASGAFATKQDGDNLTHTHSGTTAGANARHTHGIVDPGHSHQWNVAVGTTGAGSGLMVANATTNETPSSRASVGANTTGINVTQTDSPDHAHAFTTGASGGTETRPKNIAVLTCIKT